VFKHKTPLLEKEGLGEIQSPLVPLLQRGRHFEIDLMRDRHLLVFDLKEQEKENANEHE